MKKRLKNKIYLKKMVISYVILVALTAFILTFFFYQKYSEALTKTLYADYQSNLKKNAKILSDLCSEAEQLYTTIIIDQQVDRFNTLEEFDPKENYLTFLTTKKLLNINPYLHSICIYNRKSLDAVYCGSRQFDLDTGWSLLSQENKKIIYTGKLLENEEQKIMTFANPIYIDTYEEPAGGVFINFDYDRVIRHVLGETEYAQFVVDDANHILLEKQYKDEMISTKSLESIYSWLEHSSLQTDSDILELEGNAFVCSYYKEDTTGRKFISYVYYSDVIELLKQQKNYFQLASLIVMIVSILIQYLISRRLYKPIQIITQELEKSKYAKEKGEDEFKLIRQVYENAVNEIEALEEKNALYLPKLRTELIRNLLLENIEAEQIANKLMEQGWNIPFDGMFIASLKIEESSENSFRLAVAQARIQQLLLEFMGNLFYVESITIGDNEVVCLINTLENSNATFDELVSLLENVKNTVIEEYKIKLTIGVDGVVRNISQCSKVYKKVKELQNNRFVFGYNQVFYPKRVLELLPEPLAYPDKIITEILNHLVHSDREAFLEKVNDFIVTIRQYTYQTASVLFSRLYLEAVIRTRQLGVRGKEMANKLEFDQMPKTLEEGKEKMLEVFDACMSRKHDAECIKSNKHYKKIEESRIYIMNHYMDINLSADMLAEIYGYSTNYFARIFKTITGFYINDYIRQVRIMKAQELLTESDLTIVDIAEATGFTSSNYFYSIFKKETGLTPAAYRNANE